MASVKVIPDTNVIIAASIFENISEICEEFKHKFYDESIQLFSLFKKNPQDKIGIALPKVKRESYGVLARAVKEVFIPQNTVVDIRTKTLFYNSAASIIFSSDHKRQLLLARLHHIRLNEKEVVECLHKVIRMSKDLKNLYNKKYKHKQKIISEAQQRSKNIKTEPRWKTDQKDEVFYAHGSQVRLESKQLERFMRKYPNEPDQRVLAEALAVKNFLLSTGKDVSILLASRDMGFFAPYIYLGGKSDLVTQEIYNRFQIRCDYPREIFRMAGGI